MSIAKALPRRPLLILLSSFTTGVLSGRCLWLCGSMIVLMAAAQVTPATAAESDGTRVFRSAQQSIVTVSAGFTFKAPLKQGSGVVTGAREIVTNCHVVLMYPAITVALGTRRTSAVLVRARFDWDLCVVRTQETIGRPAVVAQGPYGSTTVGERVFTLGTPKGLEQTFAEGLVSAHRNDGVFPRIQISAPISAGSSGGGVFNRQGQLIAISTASVVDGQNLNFAMPASLIQALPEAISFRNSHLITDHMVELDDRGELELLSDVAVRVVSEDPSSSAGRWFAYWARKEAGRVMTLPEDVVTSGIGNSVPLTDEIFAEYLRTKSDHLRSAAERVFGISRERIEVLPAWEVVYLPRSFLGTGGIERGLAEPYLDRLERMRSPPLRCPALTARTWIEIMSRPNRGAVASSVEKLLGQCPESRLALKEVVRISVLLGERELAYRAAGKLGKLSPETIRSFRQEGFPPQAHALLNEIVLGQGQR